MKRYEFTDKEIQLIKEKYANGEGLKIIARELGFSTSKAIKRIVEEYNFNRKEKRQVNIHIFDKINTPDKAYWLGFINGDGYVSKYHLCIKLSSKDRGHLEKFAEFMNIDKSSIVDLMGQYNNPICYIYVSSKYFVDKLRQIGIFSGKNDKEHVPVNLPYKFISDYLRGLFDADGCITDKKIDLSGLLENINFMQTYYFIKYKIPR